MFHAVTILPISSASHMNNIPELYSAEGKEGVVLKFQNNLWKSWIFLATGKKIKGKNAHENDNK